MLKLSEAALQQHVKATLAGLGYHCMETGVPRRAVECPKCHHKHVPTKWGTNTVGTPDALFYRIRDDWPAVFIPEELKTVTGRMSPAQAALVNAGRVQLVRSVGDSVRAILAVEKAMHDYRFADDRNELLSRFLEENEGKI